MASESQHVFAVYIDRLSNAANSVTYTITDQSLIHRIQHVIRLQIGDELILFDRMYHGLACIISIDKKSIVVAIASYDVNSTLDPYITLYLPVLKKDALADAIYNAVESGASDIQLVHTQKAQRVVSEHELERLERVAIAAAEQSKHFSFPKIRPPVDFASIVHQDDQPHIFFDPEGSAVHKVVSNMPPRSKSIALLIGPEGDMTLQEKNKLRESQWIFCALTPTVLRAVQAVTIGLGLLRSILR